MRALGARRAGVARRLRVLLVGMVLCGLAAIAAGVTYGAYAGSVANPGNSYDSGSVAVADNDGGTAMLALSSARPGATDTSCIQVTSTGSLSSAINLYASQTGTLGTYLQLKVTRGTGSAASFDSCTGFTADTCNYKTLGVGVLYSGTLSSYPSTYAAGIVDPGAACDGSAEAWTQGEVHSYKFDLTYPSGAALASQGLTGTATFNWEGRNQ